MMHMLFSLIFLANPGVSPDAVDGITGGEKPGTISLSIVGPTNLHVGEIVTVEALITPPTDSDGNPRHAPDGITINFDLPGGYEGDPTTNSSGRAKVEWIAKRDVAGESSVELHAQVEEAHRDGYKERGSPPAKGKDTVGVTVDAGRLELFLVDPPKGGPDWEVAQGSGIDGQAHFEAQLRVSDDVMPEQINWIDVLGNGTSIIADGVEIADDNRAAFWAFETAQPIDAVDFEVIVAVSGAEVTAEGTLTIKENKASARLEAKEVDSPGAWQRETLVVETVSGPDHEVVINLRAVPEWPEDSEESCRTGESWSWDEGDFPGTLTVDAEDNSKATLRASFQECGDETFHGVTATASFSPGPGCPAWEDAPDDISITVVVGREEWTDVDEVPAGIENEVEAAAEVLLKNVAGAIGVAFKDSDIGNLGGRERKCCADDDGGTPRTEQEFVAVDGTVRYAEADVPVPYASLPVRTGRFSTTLDTGDTAETVAEINLGADAGLYLSFDDIEKVVVESGYRTSDCSVPQESCNFVDAAGSLEVSLVVKLGADFNLNIDVAIVDDALEPAEEIINGVEFEVETVKATIAFTASENASDCKRGFEGTGTLRSADVLGISGSGGGYEFDFEGFSILEKPIPLYTE